MAEKWKEATGQYWSDLKATSERVWHATHRTVSTAGTRAVGYGKLAQQRWDLSTVDRRLEATYAELGKAVANSWTEGTADPFQKEEVVRLLAEVENHKYDRSRILRRLEQARTETKTSAGHEEEGAREEEAAGEEQEFHRS